MSALSDRGIVQKIAGPALDVWAETIKQDPVVGGVGTFVGDLGSRVIRIVQAPHESFKFRTNFECVIHPVGVDPKELQIGNLDGRLGIRTFLWFREDSWDRQQGEAGLEDLEQHYMALVMSNPTLVWGPKEGDPAWPDDPPAGSSIVAGGPGQAKNAPVIFSSFYARAFEKGKCFIVAFFDTGYRLSQITC